MENHRQKMFAVFFGLGAAKCAVSFYVAGVTADEA
jgi:hypothetical protein